MTYKISKVCISCKVRSICDAHNVNGEWKHKQGINPCKINEESESVIKQIFITIKTILNNLLIKMHIGGVGH